MVEPTSLHDTEPTSQVFPDDQALPEVPKLLPDPVDLKSVERDPYSVVLGAPQFRAQSDIDKARVQAKTDEVSLREAASLSWELDSSVEAMGRIASHPQFAPDENYLLTLDALKEHLKDIPEEEHESLAANLKWSQSEAHTRWLVDAYKEELTKEQKIAAKGWAGVGVRLGVNVLDPGALALSAATGGLVGSVAKIGRLRRILKMAGVVGAENVALERLLAAASQTHGVDDALYAFFGGAIAGGGLGALTKGMTRAEKSALKRISNEMLDTLDRKALTDEGIDLSGGKPLRTGKPDEARRADLDEAELGGKVDEPVPTLRKTLEEDAEPHLTTLEARAKELVTSASRLEHALAPRLAAQKVLQALARAGEARNLGGGVSVRTIPKEAKLENLEKLTPEGRAIVDSHTLEDGQVNRKLLKELNQDIEVMQSELSKLNNSATTMQKLGELRRLKQEAAAKPEDRSVGSAQVRLDELRRDFANTDKMDRDLLDEILQSPRTAFAGWRWDIMARLKSSDNPWVRWIGGRMAEDPVANAGDEVLEVGASEMQRHLQIVMEAKFYTAATPAFDAWAAAKQLNMMERITKRRAFFEEVGIAIRDGSSNDPNVSKAANVLREIFADFVERAENARLAGFEGSGTNPRYLPRIHASDNVRRLDAVYGTGQIEKLLIKQAILNAQEGLDEAIAEKIAVGYWSRVRKIAAGQTLADLSPRGIGLDNQSLIREILEEGNLPKDEIETVLAAVARVGKGKDGPGTTPRGKSRLLLDETTEVQIKQGDFSPDKPGQVDTVRFSDLLENNAERLFHSYTRQMSGHLALADRFKDFLEPGEGFGKHVFDRIVRKAEAWGGDHGISKEQMIKDVERLNFLWKANTGAPLESDPASWFSINTRRVRELNFTRVMNQVGFAQIPEFGNLLGLGGVRNTLRHFPELKATLSRAQNGEIADEFARELVELFGVGNEWVRNIAISRWDDIHYRQVGSSKAGATVDAALDVGKRFTSVASGLVPINTLMQRSTLKAIAQKFVNMANGVERVSKKRMHSLGLSDDMLKRILHEMKRATVKEDGKVLRLNVDLWEDKEALNAFTYAGFRLARRIVQENDVGGLGQWMHSATAKIFLQFRGFPIMAWPKQLLYGIKMNDFQTYSAWSYGSAFAMLAYIGQTHLNSIGRDDRQEFLNRRLSPSRLAAATYQRVGATSVTPLVGESIWRLYGDKPLFMGRTTQLPSDLLFGNPTADLAKQTFSALKGVVRAPLFSDYDYSKKDLQALWSLFPIQNMVGITQVGNLLASDLPDTSSD